MTYLDHMDEENPVGVLSVTTGKLKEAIAALHPDLILMDERELRASIEPTNTDYCLRTAFWREYESIVRRNGPYLRAASFLKGVCSDAYFYQKFIKDPLRVAWLVRPMQTYQAEIEAILAKGTVRLWELMDMDITYVDKTGRKQIDAKKASVLVEVIKMVEARAKGHAILRSESKSLVGHVGANPITVLNDQKALEARMAQLSKEIHGVDVVKADPNAKD